MASNSRREQVLLAVISLLEDISSISSVKRVQPNSVDDIRRYSSSQMPLAVVIGGIPQPKEHRSGRGRGQVDLFISTMKVEVFVYFMDNTNPDSTISSLLDDLWAALYTDQTLGLQFCNGLVVDPKVTTAAWTPYGAFSVNIMVEYFHTIGGI